MNKLPVARAPVSEWLSQLPSVDKILSLKRTEDWLTQYGRDEVLRVVRSTLSLVRQECLENKRTTQPDLEVLFERIAQTLKTRATPNLRRVINLTGTVLHTNLGRAVMPPEVIEAMASASAEPCALEYDLGEGKRGDRDELVEELL
ncbi:MAG: L-seryl-tRNA(Sec) selenium transferase, partial [Burkholderiaceae bacterium]|nr:L-seryl-tRNA(Sec) selenium transferase [Burkholderiaceae bacterium]